MDTPRTLVDTSHILALDAMGGDHAPLSVVEGALLSLERNPELSFVFYGDEKKIVPLLEERPLLKSHARIVHTDDAIAMDEKPISALRRKDTSMRLAVEAVAHGHAAGVVSAGNTGAYMALCKIILKTIQGIERPAISTLIPTEKGRAVMLDMGANVSCEAAHLAQFALMGNVFAKETLGKEKPTVGILNVGSEEMKGHTQVQEAAALLKQIPDIINFYGFIEGDDINKGTVDVVVTDGFTGNACIKMGEGISRMMLGGLKKTLSQSLLARVGVLLALPALKKLKKQWDPGSYNGALFIGVNGVAIKSHGGASGGAFANAIGVAAMMIDHGFNALIAQDVISARVILGDEIFH